MRSAILSFVLIALAACHGHTDSEHALDSLSTKAYELRYVSMDSLEATARQMKDIDDADPRADLWLALAAYQRMDYDGADSLLAVVLQNAQNDIQRLAAQALLMKVAQRTGRGLDFFQAKRQADMQADGLAGKRKRFTPEEEELYVYALSEAYIVASTYFYYQQDDSLARYYIGLADEMRLEKYDVQQWTYCQYMLGSGGLIQESDTKRLLLQEFDHLMDAYFVARRAQLVYFEANTLQTLAEVMEDCAGTIKQNRHDDYLLLEAQNMSWVEDTVDLPLAMINHAIYLFAAYQDEFQTSCALRTRGHMLFGRGQYEDALADFNEALGILEKHGFTTPEWEAMLRQMLSLTYSALGDKPMSDRHRNRYLDIMENMDQNVEMEDRNMELQRLAHDVVTRLVVAIALCLLFITLLALYRRRMGRKNKALMQCLADLQSGVCVPPDVAALREEAEQTEEQLAMSRHHLETNKRGNAEKRAKVALVHAIVPYLDRIGGEVRKMKRTGHIDDFSRQYISELVTEIENHNAVLTQWIDMQRGKLSLRITTVRLQPLFDIVAKGRYAFDSKGVTLNVEPTTASVKADESLTLFMLNTLTDNARKFTPAGGTVTLRALEMEDCVEVQVQDTGLGLTEDQVRELTDVNAMAQLKAQPTQADGKGFGFGLMNCRNIMEKYRKQSALFACAKHGIRSEVGQGSTFFFRLPRVLGTVMAAVIMASTATAQTAGELYDSVYQCNLDARFPEALDFGAQALTAIDDRLVLYDTFVNETPREIQLYQDGDSLDYRMIMGIRNELALAALALGDWALYEYNNRIFTQLQKYANQDPSLPVYCERLETFHHRATILLAVIIVLTIIVAVLLYRLFVVNQWARTSNMEQRIAEFLQEQRGEDEQMLASLRDRLAKLNYEEHRLYVQNQILDNCLSTIKHESMYYPSRIRSLTDSMTDADIPRLSEITDYYHLIYTILSRQADEQLESPNFKRQTVRLAGHSVMADPILLDVFMGNIREWMHVKDTPLEAREVDSFVEFSLRDPDTNLSDEELRELFTPATDRIPLLVAKQILRDHDAYLGHPGLRLYATAPPQGGYEIRFTLPKKH